MKLLLTGHDDRYAIEQLQLSLFPEEVLEPVDTAFAGDGAVSALHRGKTWITAVTTICRDGISTRSSRRIRAAEETVQLRRRILQQSYYRAALPHLTVTPPWGALAGVRPTKLSTRHMLQGGSEKTADKLFKDVYFVTPSRRALALACSRASVQAARQMEDGDVSLYIGIPFCPTRCSYCSFVSRTIGKRTELLEPYLAALTQEIHRTAKLLESSGRKVRTLYIGGGTPTTLTAGQMETLLNTVRSAFDLSRCVEFTVEGGRPDTLDLNKLQTIARCGADRMSINPQTMENGVLRACGRPHTAADVQQAFAQARQAGSKATNMDLIAGLPEDTYEGFCRSLDTVAAMKPENITVHTLALKKGADLFERRANLPDADTVRAMVDYASKTLRRLGYAPYYLYRQKYMSGSFENVGWSLQGYNCLYNIYMMEELHSIISLGAGGMNKVNFSDGTLQRFHNPKFPEQYMEQLDDVLRQKEELFALMKGSI